MIYVELEKYEYFNDALKNHYFPFVIQRVLSIINRKKGNKIIQLLSTHLNKIKDKKVHERWNNIIDNFSSSKVFNTPSTSKREKNIKKSSSSDSSNYLNTVNKAFLSPVLASSNLLSPPIMHPPMMPMVGNFTPMINFNPSMNLTPPLNTLQSYLPRGVIQNNNLTISNTNPLNRFRQGNNITNVNTIQPLLHPNQHQSFYNNMNGFNSNQLYTSPLFHQRPKKENK